MPSGQVGASESQPLERQVERIASASEHAIHDLVEYLTDRRHRPQLMRLLTDSPAWLIAKSRRLGGDQSLLRDVSLAIASFTDPLAPQDVLDLLRLYAVLGVIQQRASERRGGAIDGIAGALVLADPGERFAALQRVWMSLVQPSGAGERHASLLLAARDAAATMPSDWFNGQARANALDWIVDELLSLGEHAAAHDTLALMSRTIGDREDAVVRVLLSDVASGHLDAALGLLPQIHNVWQARKAHMALAGALWRARRHDDALTMASAARRPFIRTSVLTALIETFSAQDIRTRTALLDEAVESGRTIESHRAETDLDRDWDMKAAALRSLAHALASSGQFERAKSAADEIPYAFDCALTLTEIAGIARRAAADRWAQTLLASAKSLTSQTRDPSSRAKLELVIAAELSNPLELTFRPVDVIRALVNEGRPEVALAIAESTTGENRAEMIHAARHPAMPSESPADIEAAVPSPITTASDTAVPDRDLQRLRRLEALDAIAVTLEKAQQTTRARRLRERARQLRGDRDKSHRGKAAKESQNPVEHDEAVARDVEHAIEGRRWDEAIATARRASTNLFDFNGRIAWSMIRVGEVERGYQLASTLDGSEAIGSVIALHAVGRLDLAQELVDTCLQKNPGDLALFVQALAGDGRCLAARATARRHRNGVIPDHLMVDIAMCAAARHEVDYAISAARAMQDQRDADRVLQGVVAELQHEGRAEEAEKWAAMIVDTERRAAALQGRPMLIPGTASIDMWLDGGRFGYIRTRARSVHPDMRVGMLTQLSRAHATVGEFASAIEVAREIPLGATQADELRSLAVQLASHRRFDEALDVSQDIGAAMARSLRLRGLPSDEAEQAARLSLIRNSGGVDDQPGRTNFPDQVVLALAAIATEMRAAGDPRAAATLARATRIHDLHELTRDTRVTLGRALVTLGRWSEGLRTIPRLDAHAFALEVHALRDVLDTLQAGLAVDATTAVGRIAGWFDDNWKELGSV